MPRLFAALLVTLLLPLPSSAADRAVWLRASKFGVMTHYLSDVVTRYDPAPNPMTPDRWNAEVDHFDVDGLAKQLHAIGASYYLISIGQNSGYFCAPNPTYDRLTGITPSHCSRRDLISDLSAALAKYDIRLMVYLPSGAPDKDPAAVRALQWENGPHRNAEFQAKWESVIRDWSTRWGNKISGWWFDGCYFADPMYTPKDAPNFASFAAAARAGNPDSILCFNPGVRAELRPISPEEDYTAGEIDDPSVVQVPPHAPADSLPHVLTFIGSQWAASPPRFTDAQLLTHVRRLKSLGCALTMDVPVQPTGLLPQPFVDQLINLNKSLSQP